MTQAEGTEPIQLALLIDDEAFDHKMYKRIIERSGLVGEVIGFQAADHALDYLGSAPDRPVDVIFLDINMPRMNGFEFLERAPKVLGPEFGKVCIVMLTTSLNPSDHARAKQFDIVADLISKPLTVEDLRHVADLVRDRAETTALAKANLAAQLAAPTTPSTAPIIRR